MSSTLINDIKRALLKAAVNEEPPKEIIEQEGMLDMLVKEMVTPSGRVDEEHTLLAIQSMCALLHGKARELPFDEIRDIIADVTKKHANDNTSAPRRSPTPRPGM